MDTARASSRARRLAGATIAASLAVPGAAFGAASVRIDAPSSNAGSYQAGSATFGPVITSAGVSGPAVQALDPADGSGPSTTDACSALTNAAAVSGKIAVIDRGTCGFTIKVKNAQNAGAIGVIMVSTIPGEPTGMAGTDATITIPSVMISMGDGGLLKASLPATVALLPAPTLSGTAFEDTDGDGGRGATEPVRGADWKVYIDVNGNDALDLNEPSTVTAADGRWTLTDLPPRTSTIREVPQAGWECSAPSRAAAGCEQTRTPAAGQNLTGLDLGDVRRATVSGTVLEDYDGSGAADAGEPALAGSTVFLDENSNGAADAAEPQATSDGAGAWSIPGVFPGPHTVRVVPGAGFACVVCERGLAVTSGAVLAASALALRVPPILSLAPGTLPFGSREVDAGATAVQSATVTNPGRTPVSVAGIGLGGADAGSFALLGGAIGDCAPALVLGAGQACTVRARFDPLAAGARLATATVASTAPPIGVALSGAGVIPALSLAGLKVSPSSFKAKSTVSYTLNRAATTTLAVTGLLPGVKQGVKCVAAPKKPAKGAKPCTRTVSAGSFARPSTAGANRFSFAGRVGKKKLAPGSYRLTATAKDADGLTSKAVAAPFKITR